MSVGSARSGRWNKRGVAMPRDLPVSNGLLLVMLDRQYRIRDIYLARQSDPRLVATQA
jgi:hypothetical protein